MRLSAEAKGLLLDGSTKGEKVVPSSKGISKGIILPPLPGTCLRQAGVEVDIGEES